MDSPTVLKKLMMASDAHIQNLKAKQKSGLRTVGEKTVQSKKDSRT
jgi:hypothetical protein